MGVRLTMQPFNPAGTYVIRRERLLINGKWMVKGEEIDGKTVNPRRLRQMYLARNIAIVEKKVEVKPIEAVKVEPIAQDTKEFWLSEAERLGVKHDKRWGVKKLKEAVENGTA